MQLNDHIDIFITYSFNSVSAKSLLVSLRIIPELCLRISRSDTRNGTQKEIKLLSEMKNPTGSYMVGFFSFYRPMRTNCGRG